MHRLFTFVFAVLLCYDASAQRRWDWDCNFDDTSVNGYRSRFVVDTVNYKHNIWQIGRPHKAVFDSAYSAPFALVTDTVNTYPANDTSVFIVKHPKYIVWNTSNELDLYFKYRLDIDSHATARVEMSYDTGRTWIDLLHPPSTFRYTWGTVTPPRLDTSTNGWSTFELWMPWFNGPRPDSIWYRFTFITDSAGTGKDGWMLDNFKFGDWTEGIDKVSAHQKTIVYPNPSDGNIKLIAPTADASKAVIDIYTPDGRKVYEQKAPPSALHLDLPDGNYILKYTNGDDYATQQITIKH